MEFSLPNLSFRISGYTILSAQPDGRHCGLLAGPFQCDCSLGLEIREKQCLSYSLPGPPPRDSLVRVTAGDVGFQRVVSADALEQVNGWFPTQINSAESRLPQSLKHRLKLFFITLHCNMGILQAHYYVGNTHMIPPSESDFK